MAEQIALSKLAPADYNPRRITDAQKHDLARSMDEDGDLSGIVYNVRSGHLVGGHKRIDHIRATFAEGNAEGAVVVEERRKKPNKQGTVGRGYIEHEGERFNVRLVDFDDEREIRANIKANKLGGDWDLDKLVLSLDHLASTDAGLAGTGYGTDDYGAILASLPTGNGRDPAASANDPAAEWGGMPEYEHEDKSAFQTVHVHFKSAEDRDAFAELVGQRITDNTRHLWHPEAEVESYADKRYAVA